MVGSGSLVRVVGGVAKRVVVRIITLRIIGHHIPEFSMPPIVRRILFVISGLIVGAITNMAVLKIGVAIAPMPPGTDVNTPEGIQAAMPLFSFANFLVPLLAHAIGTLVGAWVASRWSGTTSRWPALIVGAAFFIGGLSMVIQIPATPVWFMIADLGLCYFPMALLGYRMGVRSSAVNA